MTADSDAAEEPHIDWLKAVAGAMAAVASAALLSRLGAAGTVIGAAIGSLVATVASVWFAQGISSSKRTLSRRQKRATEEVGIAQAKVLRAARADDGAAEESHLEDAEEQLAEAREELDEAIVAASPVGWRQRLSRLPWKHIGLATLGLFLASMMVITAFELVAGQSVSSITGGSDSGDTTIGQVSGIDSGGGSQQSPDDGPTGTTSPSPTAEPTDGASPSVIASPSQSQEPTPAESTAPQPAETTAP